MGLLKRIQRNIDDRKYDKAIEESSGLKKICLMVRNQGIEFSFNLSRSSDTNLSFEVMEVVSTQASFADAFYSTLYDSFEKVGGCTDEMFGDLATEVYENPNKCSLISSRLYGIAFAIFVHKVASTSKTIINKKEIAEFIEASDIKENFKKEIKNNFLCMINFYDDPMSKLGAEGAMMSRDLGSVAYSLVDMKLGKGHFADPLYTIAATTAEVLASRKTSVINHNIDTLKKVKFLK